MNEAKAKKVVIANSDDKSQITAVLAATITGEHLPRQLIYKGKTTRCSPKVLFPEGWVFGTWTIIGPMRTLWRGSQGSVLVSSPLGLHLFTITAYISLGL